MLPPGGADPPPRVDWFSDHAPAWQTYLVPRFSSKSSDGLRLLFVGPYDGRCIEWALTHLVPGDAASVHVTVVDDFKYPRCVKYRGGSVWHPNVRATFDRRLADVAELRRKRGHTGFTVEVLPDLEALEASSARLKAREKYNIVYIDARSSQQVMDAMVRTFPLLTPGAAGAMVLTNNVHDSVCPRRGIDGFLDAYSHQVKVFRNAFHLFLERRTRPLAHSMPCRAEYFDGRPDEELEAQCPQEKLIAKPGR